MKHSPPDVLGLCGRAETFLAQVISSLNVTGCSSRLLSLSKMNYVPVKNTLWKLYFVGSFTETILTELLTVIPSFHPALAELLQHRLSSKGL